MKKLIYSFLMFIGIFIFIPNVFAYNSNYVPNLSLNGNGFYYFYGWTSSTSHTNGTLMSWFSESNNLGLDSQIAYKYFTPNSNLSSNDSNGFTIFFSNDNVFTQDRTYNASFLLCSYGGSLPVSSINIGTGSNVSTIDNANWGLINSFDYTTINGVQDGQAGTFNDCKLITANFKANVSGNYVALRYRTNTTTSMGSLVAFLGANFDDSGKDYTTYFNNINTSITNSQNAIINNQNSMRDAIINNQNQNTQETIDSQMVCNFYDKNNIVIDNQFLASNGSLGNSTTYGITDYINVLKAKLYIANNTTSNMSGHICFYNVNKDLISCLNVSNLTQNQEITVPDNSNYVRVSINKVFNIPSFKICQNGNQALSDNVNNLNDNITSSSTDDPDNIFSVLQNQLATNGVITQLLTLPITFYTKILNSINATCTDYSVGYLLGTEIVFPCINIADYIGSTLWGVIDILFSGLFIFTLSKKFIKVFNHMSSMKEGDVISD